MEQRINRLLGGRVLIASQLEAEHFYSHAVPKLSGVTWGGPWTLFNWFTWHFTVSWAAFTAWALWLLNARWESPVLVAYLVALGAWAASNVWVLARWFGTARAERRMQDQLGADDGLAQGGN